MLFHRYNRQLYDRATAIVLLELKVKLLRSEVIGALLYGCDTWTLLQEGYDFLRTQHRRLLLRCIGFRKKNRTNHTLSCLSALEKTGCESIETTVRRLRLLLADRIHRMGNHRLPKRLLHGTLRKVGLAEEKRGRKVKCWWECLKEDRKAFGIPDEGWLQAACNDQVWRGIVEHGVVRFIVNWRDEERRKTEERHARQDAAQPAPVSNVP